MNERQWAALDEVIKNLNDAQRELNEVRAMEPGDSPNLAGLVTVVADPPPPPSFLYRVVDKNGVVAFSQDAAVMVENFEAHALDMATHLNAMSSAALGSVGGMTSGVAAPFRVQQAEVHWEDVPE